MNNNNGNGNNALETINAAATAIASAESRVPPPTVQKRRWKSCWSIYWCFGSQKNSKRIGHAVLVPEATPLGNGTDPPIQEATQAPAISIRAPFVAPPSSPASFLPSESHSAVQSPAGSAGLNSMSSNMYSPGGPHSIFAVGPYAHETQLVTPPVFSTYTTEPSTAPFTPPPESVHLTTPSSPEVPFAKLLDPIHRCGDVGSRFHSSQHDFQSYLLQPGSPVGPLISPGSAVSGSGTSSPYPDRDIPGRAPYFPDARYGIPTKIMTMEVGANHEWGSQQACGSVTPPDAVQPKFRDCLVLDRHNPTTCPPNFANCHRHNDVLVDHRVSFEVTAEDVVRCVEKKPTALPRALQKSDGRDGDSNDLVDDDADADAGTERAPPNGEQGQRQQKQRAASLGSIKEFNFDHVNRMDSDDKPCINANWWANEKVIGNEGEVYNWPFPMMQPGCS